MKTFAALAASALTAMTVLMVSGAPVQAHKVRPHHGHTIHHAYVHGYVDGYARAQKQFYDHARKHVRRKVVRLSPGRSWYRGQIDPYYAGYHW